MINNTAKAIANALALTVTLFVYQSYIMLQHVAAL
jgi:hypothetical protein